MDFIPKVMMLRDFGYDIVRYKDIEPGFKAAKKINKLKDRDVKIVGDLVYKVIYQGLPPHFWDILHSGFFLKACPILRAIIFSGEDGVGYVCDRCITLSMGPRDIDLIRVRLMNLYSETGFVFNDFHNLNFGKSYNDLTILDLEAVSKDKKTKDGYYQQYINMFLH